jgi:hypothetical protein
VTVFYDAHDICTISSNVNLDRFLYSFKTRKAFSSCTIEVRVDPVMPVKKGTKMGIMFYYDEAKDELQFDYPWILPVRSLVAGIARTTTTVKVTPTYRMLTDVLGLGYDLGHLLEALLQTKLLGAGFSLVHGACVDYKGTGVLLPAFANTGKTMTSLGLCRSFGFRFLSDDTTLVDDEANALSYASLTNISLETLRSLGGLGLTAGDRIKVGGKAFLAKIFTTRFVQPGVYVPPEKLFGHVLDSTRVGLACFLEKGDDEVKEVEPEEATRKMLLINRREIPWSDSPYLQAYSYSTDSLDLFDLMHREETIAGDFFRKLERCYVVRSNSSHSRLVRDLVMRNR